MASLKFILHLVVSHDLDPLEDDFGIVSADFCHGLQGQNLILDQFDVLCKFHLVLIQFPQDVGFQLQKGMML